MLALDKELQLKVLMRIFFWGGGGEEWVRRWA